MTRKEAINILDDNFTVINTHGHYTDGEVEEARQMAIEALKLIPDNATNEDVLKTLFPMLSYLKKELNESWLNTPYANVEKVKESITMMKCLDVNDRIYKAAVEVYLRSHKKLLKGYKVIKIEESAELLDGPRGGGVLSSVGCCTDVVTLEKDGFYTYMTEIPNSEKFKQYVMETVSILEKQQKKEG